MKDMEFAIAGEIIARGKSSAAIPLTADMCKRFGVKIGDPIEYYYEGDNLIIKFPKKTEEF